MFSLLLLPPVCGLCLFLGLLTAARGPLVRLALTLVFTGLVAPIIGIVACSVLSELPANAVLLATALLTAIVLWRVVLRLPVARGNIRGLCWGLVLTSCTLTTVTLTSTALSATTHYAPFAVRLLAILLLFVLAHVLVSLLSGRTVSATGRGATKKADSASHELHCTAVAIPVLARPLALVGADAPYHPLAKALTAGTGPAAAFSLN
ncbi:MAG: hypothetical protein EOO60_14235 [Hymenobacter sp.]|nr:MAG: hypothetical protein EOO60_14235 [Hymenobacter sp.]